MFLHRNPTHAPPSTSNYLGLLAYIILVLISVWASGASLTTHFNLPSFLGYGIGAAFGIIAALLLASLLRAYENKSLVWLILSGAIFLLAWGASLLTNTHSFYMLANKGQMQEEELVAAADALELIDSKTESWYTTAKEDYSQQVNDLISQLVAQIKSELNPGVGPKATSLLDELNGLLRTTITTFQEPPRGSSWRAYIPVANQYEAEARRLLAEREDRIDAEQKRVMELIGQGDITKIVAELRTARDNKDRYDEDSLEKVIDRGYDQVGVLRETINNITNVDMSEVDGLNLPKVPNSKRLQKIDELLAFINEQGGWGATGAYYAILIALIVDLGAFIILWRFVLTARPEY
ncbi:MAG: hypothetical protein AAFP77_01995 [Bacteroidota bacterium]